MPSAPAYGKKSRRLAQRVLGEGGGLPLRPWDPVATRSPTRPASCRMAGTRSPLPRRGTWAAAAGTDDVAQGGRKKVAAAAAKYVGGVQAGQPRAAPGGRSQVASAARRTADAALLLRKSVVTWRLPAVGEQAAVSPERRSGARSRRHMHKWLRDRGIGAAVRTAIRRAGAAAARVILCQSITFSRMRWAVRRASRISGFCALPITALDALAPTEEQTRVADASTRA